jgi:biopolymer transport protein ExbD
MEEVVELQISKENIKRKNTELKDVDLTSFMNLMVVLIPILLASAEFAKIAVIDIKG